MAWKFTAGRKENIKKAHRRLSEYVRLGKEEYQERHPKHKRR